MGRFQCLFISEQLEACRSLSCVSVLMRWEEDVRGGEGARMGGPHPGGDSAVRGSGVQSRGFDLNRTPDLGAQRSPGKGTRGWSQPGEGVETSGAPCAQEGAHGDFGPSSQQRRLWAQAGSGKGAGPAGSLDWLSGGGVTSLPFWKQGHSQGRELGGRLVGFRFQDWLLLQPQGIFLTKVPIITVCWTHSSFCPRPPLQTAT